MQKFFTSLIVFAASVGRFDPAENDEDPTLCELKRLSKTTDAILQKIDKIGFMVEQYSYEEYIQTKPPCESIWERRTERN